MNFEWDSEKERENIKKHGIGFLSASRVFDDQCRIERKDIDSSETEDRWQTIGYFRNMLFVVYIDRGDNTRIISARVAEPFERRLYHGNRLLHGWEKAHK